MESEEVQTLVERKVKAAIQANNGELLNSIGDMINKISAPASSSSAPSSVWDAPTFKRKSNEEQFKLNRKVLAKLQETESHIERNNIADAKQSVIEGIYHILKSDFISYRTQRT